jgi:hypothetical protein
MNYKTNLLFFLLSFFLFLSADNLRAQTTLKGNYVLTLDPKDLEGDWHLYMSTARKWNKNRITERTQSYLVQGTRVTNEVKYKSRSVIRHHLKSRKSTKVFEKSQSSLFTSTGKAIPKFFSRSWYVVAMDSNKQWMVLYFSGKLFHREEVEVISRDKEMTEDGRRKFAKLCEENYFLHSKTSRIKILFRSDSF